MKNTQNKVPGKIKTILFVLLWTIVLMPATAQESNNDFEISKNLDIFSDLYKQLDLNYVDEINPGELMKTGIDAMLETLDPFTNYIPEAEIEDYRLMTTGQYGGIGALIQRQNEFVVISEPYKDFPADKAGLKAGDKILEIDGQSAKNKNSDEISQVLKGEPGTTLELLVSRPGVDQPFTVTIKRENITIDNIPYAGLIAPHIGYIKLTGFTTNAYDEVKAALLTLREDNELEGLVLDLRGNGGGLLNEAVDIVSLFTPQEELVVSTKGKESSRNKSYYTSKKALDEDLPLVVLVNGNSASASEIVSGAIQDLDRGIILGQRTYGKGLVQNVLPLSYNSKVKVTVAKYYIPSGRCIQAIDYSHKDDEGVAHQIPDSLISEFKTQNGRKVYDGGGIEPDIYYEPETLSPVTVEMFRDFIFFEYATLFAQQYDSIPDVADFEITDEIYADFEDFVKSKDFEYTTNSEKTLKKLKEIAGEEAYLDDISDKLAELETILMANKDEDLQTHRNEISDILKIEIATRYYYQKGKVKASLSNDPEIKKAIEIIRDQKHYASLLSGENAGSSRN